MRALVSLRLADGSAAADARNGPPGFISLCAYFRTRCQCDIAPERQLERRNTQVLFRRYPRHCERSEAIHFAAQRKNGLLRWARNDVESHAPQSRGVVRRGRALLPAAELEYR